jgi:hypothetical protein
MSTYQSNVTSAFVDHATFDALEAFLYAGVEAVTYFVRQHRKSTWFSQVPVVLSNANGIADFGQDWGVTVSRAGDYLLHTWLSVTTPKVAPHADYRNFWCKNFMHNLVRTVTLTFNDLIAAKIESFQLDFWTAFNVSASKKAGYRNMVGYGVETLAANGRDNVFLHGLDAAVPHNLQLPLPFFFSRESGVALPTAALPYNDIRINFVFRSAIELLAAQTLLGVEEAAGLGTTTLATTAPTFGGAVKVWANYAVVGNDERALMGQSTRDIVIEQFQAAPVTTILASNSSTFDIRFNSAVKCLMFGIRNNGINAGTHQGVGLLGAGGDLFSRYDVKTDADEVLLASVYTRVSPVASLSLLYENTTRLGSVPSNYFTQINPYYHAESIPSDEPGIHMYSYALDVGAMDPMGSTNYGRLTNVTLVPATTGDVPTGSELCVMAIVHNIARISGGAFGFPIL